MGETHAKWLSALKPRAALATHFAGFPPAPPRSTERARKPFYLFPAPPQWGDWI